MTNLKRYLIVPIICSFLIGCGGSANSLSGSIADFDYWNLGFDSVDIRLFDEGLKIRYLREVEGAEELDIVASVMVLTSGTNITAGEDIDLGLYGEVDRFVRVYEDGALVVDDHPFPGIQSGKIRFSKLSATDGGPVEGEFFVLFTNGYTLNGKFSGTLIVQN